jgi:hypothetical protein
VFQVFTGTTPVEVPAGGSSGRLPFDELTSGDDPATMFLRVVALGTSPGPPTVVLHTDRTPPLTLTGEFAGLVTSDGTVIADAAIAAEGDGTFRVRVLVHQLGSEWALTITNHDPEARRYVGVVADDRDETRQPWIDVPAALRLDGGVGVPRTRHLVVSNLGTGPLRVSMPPGLGGGEIELVLPPPVPPNGRAELGVTFTGTTVGTRDFVLVLASNDPAATVAPGHNHRIALRTRTRWLPPQTVLMLLTATEPLTDVRTATLVRVDPDTGRRTAIASFPDLATGHPVVYDLAVEADGSALVLRADVPGILGLFVDEPLQPFSAIERVNPLTGQRRTQVRGWPLVGALSGVVNAAGQVLVAVEAAPGFGSDLGVLGGAVLRVDLDTTDDTTDFFSVVAPSELPDPDSEIFPRAAALAPDDDLWVITSPPPEGRIVRVDTDTGTLTPAFPGAGVRASRIVADLQGRLLVAGPDGILRIDPRSGERTTLVPPPVETRDLLLDAAGRLITTQNGALVRIRPDTGEREVLSPAPVVDEGEVAPTIVALGIVPWDPDAVEEP